MCISRFSCLIYMHRYMWLTCVCFALYVRTKPCLFCFVCACVHACTTPGPVPLGASHRHRAPDIAERLSIAAFQSWCNNDAGLHFNKVEIRGLKEERQPPVRRSSLTPPPPSLPPAQGGRVGPERSLYEWQACYHHHHTLLPVLMENAPDCQCLCLPGHGNKYAWGWVVYVCV